MSRTIQKIRTLLSEFQLPLTAWTQVIPIVQSALNDSVILRLANRCPLTAFTGLLQDTPLRTIKRSSGKEIVERSLNNIRYVNCVYVTELQNSLEVIHKHFDEFSDKKQRSAVESHNRKTNIHPVNFTKGHYMLRGTIQCRSARKPLMKWNGPFRVVECRSNYIFVIENLLFKKREEAHGRRLRFSEILISTSLKNS